MNPAFREGRTEEDKVVDILRTSIRGMPISRIRISANIWHHSVERMVKLLVKDGFLDVLPPPKKSRGRIKVLYKTSRKGVELLLEVRDQEQQKIRSKRVYHTWDLDLALPYRE